MPRNTPFMIMKALRVMQCLSMKALSSHDVLVLLRNMGKLPAIYYLTLATASTMRKKPLKIIIVVVMPNWLTMPKS